GGGATGAGVALEAATRGYETLLVERGDFGQGTSSRSTKLVHGGVRYLRQGRLGLVYEALRERSRLLRNAPHVVRSRAFLLPAYRAWERPWYGLGLKLYDLLSGPHNLEGSRLLSRRDASGRLPNLERRRLRGGVLYHDGQFDDGRLVISLIRSLLDAGGTALNYAAARDIRPDGSDEDVGGVLLQDRESGEERTVRARVVVNATGPYADSVRRMADPDAEPVIRPSRGSHLVFDREVLGGGGTALIVPRTRDGRVIFAIPWHHRVLVGTTDVPVDEPPARPRPTEAEIRYLLEHLEPYLADPPGVEDVRSCFAGVRPLVAADGEADTAELSRDHRVLVSDRGLVTVVGGKWTTYREMGEDAVDRAAREAGLPERESVTRELELHGAERDPPRPMPWRAYGSDAPEVRALAESSPSLGETLHPRLPYRGAQVAWAARHELARTVEDVLARRTPALFLDARAAAESAPRAARILARELDRSESWAREQAGRFREIARGYLPRDASGLPASEEA
ncbi:MAG: glycerol-3-phosphate dehydrogenase/oxidase, partial [Gemmatimonadota bacterium]